MSLMATIICFSQKERAFIGKHIFSEVHNDYLSNPFKNSSDWFHTGTMIIETTIRIY